LTLAQKALAYGIKGIQVDGNDILAVYAAADEAVQRARSGSGATLIECITYRMTVHTTADDPRRYRTEEDVAAWRKRDPIDRYQKYLIGKGLLTDGKIETEEKAIQDKIQAAVERAEERMKSLGDPLNMFDHAYADMPPQLSEQKEFLARELAEGTGE
jgi:pyruvate dehydrogenase E1 component alpha subunit